MLKPLMFMLATMFTVHTTAVHASERDPQTYEYTEERVFADLENLIQRLEESNEELQEVAESISLLANTLTIL